MNPKGQKLCPVRHKEETVHAHNGRKLSDYHSAQDAS